MKTVVHLLLLLLCGCASTVPPLDMPAKAPITQDKATVYVIQGTLAIASENVPVFVAGEKIGPLSLRSYTWFQCAPGAYKVAIGDVMLSHRMVAASEVSLSAGDIVYLKYVLNSRPNEIALVGGFLGDLVSGKQMSTPDPLIRITKEEAEKLMAGYRLVGNTYGRK